MKILLAWTLLDLTGDLISQTWKVKRSEVEDYYKVVSALQLYLT